MLQTADVARVGESTSAYTNVRFTFIAPLNMNNVVLWNVETCS